VNATEQAPVIYQSAVYALDLVPDDAPANDGIPAYGGVEMQAGSLRWGWVALSGGSVRAPIDDPSALWSVSVRVGRDVSRQNLVAALLALAGALEADRMPEPEVAAAHPRGRVIVIGPDPAPAVEAD
jgi:hypothetical protein